MNNSANVFAPKEQKPDKKKGEKPKSSFGQKVKMVVLFPFYLVAAAIFARNLGK